MKVDVAKAVLDILVENGSVRIPGLGNFDLKDIPAKFSPGKQSMSPPSKEVVFSEEKGDSEELINKIKKDYKLRKVDAVKAVDLFSDKIFKNLLKFDKVRITGLGMLNKRKDDSVEFEVNKSFIQQFNYGLPSVRTQIKSKTKRTSSKTASAASKSGTDQSIKKSPTTKSSKSTSKTKVNKKVTAKKDVSKKVGTKKSKESDKKSKVKAVAAAAPVKKPVEVKPIEKKVEVKTPVVEKKTIAEKLSSEKSIEVVKTDIAPKTSPIAEALPEIRKVESVPAKIETTRIEKVVEPVSTIKEAFIGAESKTVASTPIKSEPARISYNDDKDESLWPVIWPVLLFLGFIAACIFGVRKCSSDKVAIGDPIAVVDEGENEVVLDEHGNPIENSNSAAASVESEDGNDVEYAGGNEATGSTSSTNSTSSVQSKPTSSGTASSSVSEDSSLTTNPSECIIITGVFSRQKYADEMILRMKTAGYIPYAEKEGEVLRVGFKFECSDTDLKEYLRNVRRLIAKDAWYLQPSLHVD